MLRERNANGSPRDDVRFVTITIGGNDIFTPIITNCFADPIPPRSPTCVATIDRVLDSYEANLDRILRDLREAAGRHTTIVVTRYDNPLPACVLAHLTVLGNDVLEDDDLPGFNDRTAIVAARYGVEMANAFRRLGAGQMVGGSDCQHPIRKATRPTPLSWRRRSSGKESVDGIKAVRPSTTKSRPRENIISTIRVPERSDNIPAPRRPCTLRQPAFE